MKKTRYTAVGTGNRIAMFIDSIARDYSKSSELTALCDLSATRMQYHRDRLVADYGYHRVNTYHPSDFERMIKVEKPDVVIVCTMDSTHHEYIVRSLELDCDVISEKPITVDDKKCREIASAVKRTGRSVRVTFNCRWAPDTGKIREIIQSGRIGSVKHVHMEYMLNTRHGADYFRRWHSKKEHSGGLLVHKSTHHFDLVNWWINEIPDQVYAVGDLVFYGRKNAVARGDGHLTGYDRYTGKAGTEDPFRLDLTSTAKNKALYYDAEDETGYIRDRNVFRDDIDIEDCMSVIVGYRGGATLNYSLNAYSPLEGYRVSINGDRGRLEYEDLRTNHVLSGKSDEDIAANNDKETDDPFQIRVIPHFGCEEWIEVPKAEGTHGGGDPPLQRQMFDSDPPPDHLGRSAGHEQGIASVLIGVAANRSIECGRAIAIRELASLSDESVKLDELI